MTAILRRELNAYFRSPIGYIYLAVFYVFASYFFTISCLLSGLSELNYTFSSMVTVIMFLIPILTMRLFSEEKKNKTDQALLTAPVSLTGVVLGKFFAALLVFGLGLLITLVYGLIITAFTPPNWTQIFANFAAMLLLGAALIAIGMFISSLTENQVIAATGGFAAALALLLLDSLSGMTSNELVSKIFSSLSFFNRYNTFTSGIFNFSNILFFFSVCCLFCFFTIRVLDKRRWS